jgi:hypothetical protein
MQSEPLDSGDLDALIDLERSRGYALVRERILAELERYRTGLEADSDIGWTSRLRGKIEALRTVLEIPEILKAEIKGALKG